MKKGALITGVDIVDITTDGRGLGKVDGEVVFVEKAIPGDRVEVEVTGRRKGANEAIIQAYDVHSKYAADPFCEYFGTCGGCKWQHLAYEGQLIFKEKQVKDAFERVAKLTAPTIYPIIGSEKQTFYRNKLEFTFSNRRWFIERTESPRQNALGFHIPGRFDKVLDIETCYLQSDASNAIKNETRNFSLQNDISFYDLKLHTGLVRNLIIRTASTGETMVIVVFAHQDRETTEKFLQHLHETFPVINSLLYVINEKKNDTLFDQDIHVFKGNDFIMERMGDLQFRVSAKSFYQTNSAQAEKLYHKAIQMAELHGEETLYDLYTGSGTIANYVARQCKKVIGVEFSEDAIKDARINSEINGITNTVFFSGDVKDVFGQGLMQLHGLPDVVITDPPRAGMHENVLKSLLSAAPEKIIYISCNPATQARDIALLKEAYDLIALQPVDMFPHTQHVENIASLRLRRS